MPHSKPLSHSYEGDGQELISDYAQRDLGRIREKIDVLKLRIASLEAQLPEVGIYGRRALLQTLGELEREIKEFSEEVNRED